MDQGLAEGFVHGLAQAMHVYFEVVAVRWLVAPDRRFETLSGDRFGAGAHQALQQGPADGRQVQLLPGATDFAGGQFHDQVVDLQTSGLAAAPHAQRANSGDQLGQFERLDQVVVGPRSKTGELVRQRIQRGEHQDGRLTALLT